MGVSQASASAFGNTASNVPTPVPMVVSQASASALQCTVLILVSYALRVQICFKVLTWSELNANVTRHNRLKVPPPIPACRSTAPSPGSNYRHPIQAYLHGVVSPALFLEYALPYKDAALSIESPVTSLHHCHHPQGLICRRKQRNVHHQVRMWVCR